MHIVVKPHPSSKVQTTKIPHKHRFVWIHHAFFFIICPYIYYYIVTLPWTQYHGFRNTRDYGPKQTTLQYFNDFTKRKGLHCEAPMLHDDFSSSLHPALLLCCAVHFVLCDILSTAHFHKSWISAKKLAKLGCAQ